MTKNNPCHTLTQLVQEPTADAPTTELYNPAEHVVHTVAPVASAEYAPAGQAVQAVGPGSELYLPAAHAVQTADVPAELTVLNLPLGQELQRAPLR